jgi:hypothetical protein
LFTAECRRYRGIWAKLSTANAGPRVSRGEDLISAAMSFFDGAVLAAANQE